MRPLLLKLKGFTSFRDEQEIDFSDLDLFVIWGPTGSGKSSLLDAMTYALFGRVERVGDEPKHLVSQGQPRMAVTLDFAVGDAEYRVARSTTAGGDSKVVFERREGADWVSYGEGADRVREVNRIIASLIGLNYDAFTRSVILPQGRFAEFLTGDEKSRREILTELLGLELFGTMAKRANEIAKTARLHAENKRQLLEREYGGVDEATVGAAKEHEASCRSVLAAAESLESELVALEARWIETQRLGAEASACAVEVGGISSSFAGHAIALEDLRRDLEVAEKAAEAAKIADKAAQRDLAAAEKARAQAETGSGALEELTALRAKAEQLGLAVEDVETAKVAVESQRSRTSAAKAERADAQARLAAATEALVAVEELASRARAALDDAHKHHAVGALVSGLTVADPCPVCERPLASIPKDEGKAFDQAAKAADKADRDRQKATEAESAAKTVHALAAGSFDQAKKDLARCEKELDKASKRSAEAGTALAAALGRTTEDPISEIDKRIAGLRALIERAGKASEARDDAARELAAAETRVKELASSADRIRGSLSAANLRPLFDRVSACAPDLDLPEVGLELPEQPQELATVAASTAKELETLADDLRAIATAHRSTQNELLAEASAAMPEGLGASAASVGDLVKRARDTGKRAASEAAVAKEAVRMLTERLANKTTLVAEIEVHVHEKAVYTELGKELRSDNIVQFLQSEALVALAAAATVYLRDLSNTRYRLAFEDDRFFVIDSWNGDERRNVKTLSGGETFMASLALALALSEQVQHLAVSERDRLESLFLDEGFGTLDAESLEVVVEAIDALGGDGRVVGVITHVAELADRLPVRFEIHKSPRGSSIERSAEELTARRSG